MPRVALVLVPLLALTACTLAPAEDDETMTSEDGLAAASGFDHPGLSHHAQTIGLKHQNAPIRNLDGNPTGMTVTGKTLRMQGLELVQSPIGDMYYTWGDGQPSGFLHVSDLTARPDIDVGARAGNGQKCTLKKGQNGQDKSYWVRPQPIESDSRYEGPSTHESYSLKWYGVRGQGYTYLSWSWVDVAGGGVVRALVRDGDIFYPCAVHSLTTHSVASPGWVKVLYGMVQSNGHHYYGWLVHSHAYGNGPTVMHLALRNP